MWEGQECANHRCKCCRSHVSKGKRGVTRQVGVPGVRVYSRRVQGKGTAEAGRMEAFPGVGVSVSRAGKSGVSPGRGLLRQESHGLSD